jgi:hypothetical protein
MNNHYSMIMEGFMEILGLPENETEAVRELAEKVLTEAGCSKGQYFLLHCGCICVMPRTGRQYKVPQWWSICGKLHTWQEFIDNPKLVKRGGKIRLKRR